MLTGMLRLVLASLVPIGASLVAIGLGAPVPASAQADDAFETIRDWDADLADKPQTESTLDTLRLRAGRIWTRHAYADFVLRFEYRPLTETGGGELLLRSSIDAGRDVHAYEVVLGHRAERGRVSASRQVLHELGFTAPPPIADAAAWVVAEVRAEGDRLSVSLDGVVVSTADRAETRIGVIGFRAARGGVELRGMRVAKLALDPVAIGVGLPRANAPGITAPTVTRRAYPAYTKAAMQAKAQGVATVEFVVEADGRIGEVRVLDAPHPDLARTSVECLRKWRFMPAVRDNVPIAVVATMELSFRLK